MFSLHTCVSNILIKVFLKKRNSVGHEVYARHFNVSNSAMALTFANADLVSCTATHDKLTKLTWYRLWLAIARTI